VRSRAAGESPLSTLQVAVLRTLCYGDVFGWPFTPAEIHRYLPIQATPGEVDSAISSAAVGHRTSRRRGLVALRGRDVLFDERRLREAASARQLPRALRAARAVAVLPFVRFVGITGSLAVGASERGADVDLFVIAESGRLWLTRALAVGVVRIGDAAGINLCPNYLLADSALAIPEHDRFTAHELVQMLPVAGADAYAELLAANEWVRGLLPNAERAAGGRSTRAGIVGRAAEAALRRRPFDRLERWEMDRKIRRLTAVAGADRSAEVRFSPTVCKGHVEGHRRRALEALAAREAAVLGADA
jgi:hypothetical protein